MATWLSGFWTSFPYKLNVVTIYFQLFKICLNKIRLKSKTAAHIDNASSMSGVYSGAQARLHEKNNLVLWFPCSAHSLNLIISSAAERCIAAVNCFSLVQALYNFMSASPQRWSHMMKKLRNKAHVLQSLSGTRWSPHSDACKVSAENYVEVKKTLLDCVWPTDTLSSKWSKVITQEASQITNGSYVCRLERYFTEDKHIVQSNTTSMHSCEVVWQSDFLLHSDSGSIRDFEKRLKCL